jgi:uncharacterized membrane protein
MRGSACGRDNLESFKFCSECGGALRQERVCPSCDAVNPAERTCCASCGAAFAAGAQPPSLATPPLPVSFAGGRYAVRSFLGEGGRKRVYLAHDERLARDVAVAVIKSDGLDGAALTRVQR